MDSDIERLTAKTVWNRSVYTLILYIVSKNCWNELLKAKLDIVDFLPMSKQLTFCRHIYTFNSKYQLCGGD